MKKRISFSLALVCIIASVTALLFRFSGHLQNIAGGEKDFSLPVMPPTETAMPFISELFSDAVQPEPERGADCVRVYSRAEAAEYRQKRESGGLFSPDSETVMAIYREAERMVDLCGSILLTDALYDGFGAEEEELCAEADGRDIRIRSLKIKTAGVLNAEEQRQYLERRQMQINRITLYRLQVLSAPEAFCSFASLTEESPSLDAQSSLPPETVFFFPSAEMLPELTAVYAELLHYFSEPAGKAGQLTEMFYFAGGMMVYEAFGKDRSF